MYTISVTGDTRPLDRVIGVLERFDEDVRAQAVTIARELYAELRPLMLAGLQFYPPVPAGSRYVRTYRLRRGWTVNLEIVGNGAGLSIDLVVTNPTPYTRWVVGTLTNVDALARLTQQAFHARNGWPLALNTTRYWFDQYRDGFVAALALAVGKLLQKPGK